MVWSATNTEAHSGQYSAHIGHDEKNGIAHLLSSPFVVSPDTRYSLAFFAKYIDDENNSNVPSMSVSIVWYKDGEILGLDYLPGYDTIPEDWTSFTTGYICPYPEADAASWRFQYLYQTLQTYDSFPDQGVPEDFVFVDDVSYAAQSGVCPVR